MPNCGGSTQHLSLQMSWRIPWCAVHSILWESLHFRFTCVFHSSEFRRGQHFPFCDKLLHSSQRIRAGGLGDEWLQWVWATAEVPQMAQIHYNMQDISQCTCSRFIEKTPGFSPPCIHTEWWKCNKKIWLRLFVKLLSTKTGSDPALLLHSFSVPVDYAKEQLYWITPLVHLASHPVW